MCSRANLSRREKAVSFVALPAQVVIRWSVFKDQEVQVCLESMDLWTRWTRWTSPMPQNRVASVDPSRVQVDHRCLTLANRWTSPTPRLLIPAKTDFRPWATLVYFWYIGALLDASYLRHT